MRLVVSDAGPLHYLVLVEAADVVPKLFRRVLIPEAVAVELSHPATPSAVRGWLDDAPIWLERRQDFSMPDVDAARRGAGERAAIALAQSVNAHLILIDDRAGDMMARSCDLETIGTLGILVLAAQLDLIDLEDAFARLQATNFRCRPELLSALLAKHRKEQRDRLA